MSGKKSSLFKKLHKWPGLIIAFLLLYYAVSGIFMNHRELFSRFDVSRKPLPKEFQYTNWNNSALKSNLIVTSDSILVFGNVGIWVTDSTFVNYNSLNAGFPKGVDNRKIFDVHRSANGELYAATQFGLFAFNQQSKKWQDLRLDVSIKRFVGIESVGDTIYALNRSFLFKGKSEGTLSHFEKIELAAPLGYKNEVSVFKTMWQIHSGEIVGLPGKLFVDLLGLVTLFLSLTGIIYFFFPKWMKRRKRKEKPISNLAKTNRWSLKWHNFTGAWLFVFLIVLFFTGMFLRPPLLIAIARLNTAPIKYSHLDQPNPWYDKLRDILYDAESEEFLISTSDGMFRMGKNESKPIPFQIQPPVSVMGINVLEHYNNGAYLIGSFSGLYLWHPAHPEIYDFAKGQLYQGAPSGRPVGDYKVTGFLTGVAGEKYLVEYDRGAIPVAHQHVFPEMPQQVLTESKMSLWNLSLEIHTGRFFRFLFGNFYILLVPLSSLIAVMVVFSGYMVYRKKFKRK
ncbi:MAG: PepSY domain-containing protein [Prolixibacteraceae bacterium]